MQAKVATRKHLFSLLAALLVIITISVTVYWYIFLRDEISTDDAYVTGNSNTISAQVTGSVVSVNATDTNYVQAGDVLVTLDDTDAVLTYKRAKHNLANSVRNVRKTTLLDAQYHDNIAAARVQYQQSLADYRRDQGLAASRAISAEMLQHAKDSVTSNKANLDAAIEVYNANKALIMDTPLDKQPQILQAADEVTQAWIALQRTRVRSPVTGYVAQRTVQVGDNVQPGQALMAVIPAREMWVNANFKETQLGSVRIGQPVTLTSDLYGSDVVYHGRVKGIKMGTGNAFSLIPAQNASGNWIKIVQRVPIDVTLDARELEQHPLRLGLSMNATINTRHTSTDELPILSTTPASTPVYTSHALVVDTQPVASIIGAIITANGQS